jgi:hypothetical protein
VVRLWTLRTGHFYSEENIPLIILVRGWVDPRFMVRPEGLWQWKIPMMLRGFRLLHTGLKNIHEEANSMYRFEPRGSLYKYEKMEKTRQILGGMWQGNTDGFQFMFYYSDIYRNKWRFVIFEPSVKRLPPSTAIFVSVPAKTWKVFGPKMAVVVTSTTRDLY